jgi:hypothetical protein
LILKYLQIILRILFPRKLPDAVAFLIINRLKLGVDGWQYSPAGARRRRQSMTIVTASPMPHQLRCRALYRIAIH